MRKLSTLPTPDKTFYCCSHCGLDCKLPSSLGKHLIEVHKLPNYFAQGEVAQIENLLLIKRIEEEYEGFWFNHIHDTFIVTKKKTR